MKVSRAAFTSAIAMAAKITPNSATMPIFTSVLIAHRDSGCVAVSATDLETSLYLELPYSNAPLAPLPGAACVHAKGLLKLLKTLDGADLELAWKPAVEGGSDVPSLLLNGMAIEGTAASTDFPVLPTPTNYVAVPGLYSALEFCLPFSSNDASRYALCSVYVNSEKKAKTTVVAATDGHRLATAWLPKSEFTALIPKQALQVLFSPPFKANRESDMVSISPADKAVVFPLKTGYLTSRLLDGTFPTVEQVIPSETSTQAIIAANRTGLILTLNRAIALAQVRAAPITIIGDPGSSYYVHAGLDGEIRLDPNGGGVVPANGGSGEVAIGLNAHYLKSALDGMSGDVVEIHVKDALTPIWLTEGKLPTKSVPATWQKGKRTIVIMPMRTDISNKAIEAARKTTAEAKAS